MRCCNPPSHACHHSVSLTCNCSELMSTKDLHTAPDWRGARRLLLAISIFLTWSLTVGSANATLIGYWKFDERLGTTTTDSSGNGRSGTLLAMSGGTAPAWIGDGIRGGALHLTGTGYVDVVNSAGLNFTTGGFSIVAWVRYGSMPLSSYFVAGKTVGGVAGGYGIGYAYGVDPSNYYWNTLYSYLCCSPSTFASVSYNNSQWHFVVETYDGTVASFYIDGQLIGAKVASSPPPTAVDVTVGGALSFNGQYAYGFIGDIDEVQLYDAPLSASALQCLYQEYATPAPPLGSSIQTPSSDTFFIQSGQQQAETVCLTNTSTTTRTATLSVANSTRGLAISASGSVSLPAGTTVPATITVDATDTDAGVYSSALLQVALDDGTALYPSIGVTVQAGSAPSDDFAVGSTDISVSTLNLEAGTGATLTAQVHNQGQAAATNVPVAFYDLGTLIGQTTIALISAGGVAGATVIDSNFGPGDHVIQVVVDSSKPDSVTGSTILRASSPAVASDILVTGSVPSTIYASSTFTVSGNAVYDVVVNGVANTSYVVQGGLVQVTLQSPGGIDGGTEEVFGSLHTDTGGLFSNTVQAPPSVGTYQMLINVSDQTLSGARQLPFIVTAPPPPPDAGAPPPAPPATNVPVSWGTGSYAAAPNGGGGGGWTWTWTWSQTSVPPASIPASDLYVYSQDIVFSDNNPTPNEEITIAGQIHYWASDSTMVATNVPIDFYVTPVGASPILVGQTTIPTLSVASPDFGSRIVYATWRNAAAGAYIVGVAIDPSYQEAVMTNNAATRAIIVGSVSTNLGAVSGVVTDPWGGHPGVEVDVLNPDGSTFGSSTSDKNGQYLVQQVPSGSWTVRIVPPSGYVPDASSKMTTVAGGAVSDVNFSLTQPSTPAPALPWGFALASAVGMATAGWFGMRRGRNAVGARSLFG